ncbi:MAG: hypothetical protein ABIO50_11170 [Nitrosospira sp.]
MDDARITAESGVRISAVYRQEDAGALGITLGILEHLHVHFKLARSEVMPTRASVTLTLLPSSAPLLSVTSTSARTRRQPKQPIEAPRELSLGRIDQLDAANCRGEVFLCL